MRQKVLKNWEETHTEDTGDTEKKFGFERQICSREGLNIMESVCLSVTFASSV